MTQEVAVINVIYKKMGIFYFLVLLQKLAGSVLVATLFQMLLVGNHEKGGEAYRFPSFEVMGLSATWRRSRSSTGWLSRRAGCWCSYSSACKPTYGPDERLR